MGDGKKNHKKNNIHLPPFLLAIIDAFLVNASFLFAFWLRFKGNVPEYNLDAFLEVFPWLSIAAVIIFGGLGTYERQRNGFINVLRSSLTGITCIFIVTLAITFWFRGFAFPRSVLLLGLFIQMIVIISWRFIYWYLEKRVHGVRNLLVVGPLDEVEKLLEKVLDSSQGWFKVNGVLDVSQIDQLHHQLEEIDAVLLVPPLIKDRKASVLSTCQRAGCDIFLVPDFYDILLINTRMAQFDDLPVMEIQDMSLKGFQRVSKRIMDIAVSSLGLVLMLPVILICALIIRLTSKGPVFYSQARVGKDQVVFRLLKFRTMIQDAEKKTGPVLASNNDPRITRIGNFLRITRLDELPQLFNVLKGEMSLVGPRPERPVFVKHFERQYSDYNYRHLVKPGITGLAQVAAKYTTSPGNKLKYELYYIRNYSLLMDFKIILQTIPVLFNRESSAGTKDVSADKRAVIHSLVNNPYDNKNNNSSGGF